MFGVRKVFAEGGKTPNSAREVRVSSLAECTRSKEQGVPFPGPDTADASPLSGLPFALTKNTAASAHEEDSAFQIRVAPFIAKAGEGSEEAEGREEFDMSYIILNS